MRFFEFGDRENKKIILIHGANIPWQMWTPQIEYFRNKYFVIVPALDGHIADDNSVFYDVRKAAQKIEEYYIGHYGKEIFSVCGMSMGGTIAGILWANGNLRIKKLILESAPLVPMNPLITSINTRQNLDLIHKVQQRDKSAVSMCEKIYSKDLLPHFLKMLDTMDDKTVINCISSFGKYRLPKNLETTGMDIVFFHGTVFMEIMAKKSAKYIKKVYPQIEVKCFQGYNHCELSVNHPEQYIEEVEKAFSKAGAIMKDKITLCGDNCIYCPRYNAKTEEELNKVAELWYRVGMRDRIISSDEMRCSGCTPHKVCAYKLFDCTKEHSVEKCNQCIEYPCGKITEMLNRVNGCKETWPAKCSENEYALFEKAFFQKEENLNR